MKNRILLILAICSVVSFVACDDDDNNNSGVTTVFDYHSHVNSPNTDDKKVGDTLMIDVTFESRADETIHHVNVSIFNADDTDVVIYNKPTDAHIHETDGVYEYRDTLVLDSALGVEGHSNWVLDARVWGMMEGEGEARDTVRFHVHPN